MKGQLVTFDNLPSKGYSYPENIEIYVRPLSIKEQIDMERYGISDSEYFNMLLNGVTIEGNFNKHNLLHSDVQFLDIVRRLYSFDTKDYIKIKDCKCPHADCQNEFDFSFKIDEFAFTDFNSDIFGKQFILCEGTEDELVFTVSPITVSEYLTMSRQIRNYKDKKSSLSNMYADYMCACIRDVEGRTFKDKRDRDSFLKGFISDLYMAKDKKVVKQIIDETLIKLEPFRITCEACGREVEVEVAPTSNFQQD